MSVVVVLGMHKSGTTLIADTLHRSGIAMIEAEVAGGYDDGNKMERAATVALNMDLLGDDGIESLRLINPLSPDAVHARHKDCAQQLVAALGPDTWGFKDPRTVLTFDFWDKMLEAPILIGVYRAPVEVFRHYLRRAGRRRWISRDPSYLPDALRAWCVYNHRLLELKRQNPNMLFLDYADFMTKEAGMQSLSKHLGRELVDCRKPAMRRAKAIPNKDYRLARLIVRLRDRLDPIKIHAQLKEAASK